MPSAAPRPLLAALRTYGLAALWALAAAAMVLSHLSDPFNPEVERTHPYGHNQQGALGEVLVVSLVELAVLYLILRPWKQAESFWPRLLAVLALLVPWTVVSAYLTMHAGGIVALHFLWLFAVVIVLVASLAFSAGAALKRHLRPQP
jgi:hypothetical protein